MSTKFMSKCTKFLYPKEVENSATHIAPFACARINTFHQEENMMRALRLTETKSSSYAAIQEHSLQRPSQAGITKGRGSYMFSKFNIRLTYRIPVTLSILKSVLPGP